MLALQAIVLLVIQLPCVPSPLPPAAVLVMLVIMMIVLSIVRLVTLHVSLAPHLQQCVPLAITIQEGISLEAGIAVYVVLDTSISLLTVYALFVPIHA